MSRQLKCNNKECEDDDPTFSIRIEVNKYRQGSSQVHYKHYPASFFTCNCCGLPLRAEVLV